MIATVYSLVNWTRIRASKQLSYGDVAKMVGIPVGEYAAIEKGVTKIDLTLVEKIAAALEIQDDQPFYLLTYPFQGEGNEFSHRLTKISFDPAILNLLEYTDINDISATVRM